MSDLQDHLETLLHYHPVFSRDQTWLHTFKWKMFHILILGISLQFKPSDCNNFFLQYVVLFQMRAYSTCALPSTHYVSTKHYLPFVALY